MKDEIVRPLKDGGSSYSRVHRSTHSSRSSRVTKPRDSRYNPYSYVRSHASSGKQQDVGKEQLWKEKQLRPLKIYDQQPRDTASASAGNTNKLRSLVTEEGPRCLSDQSVTATVAPKSSTSTEKPPLDNNVTYRPHSTQLSHIEVAEDLIPPYSALKINALNEHDIENEDEIADVDMEDTIMGNELVLIEDDDMLGEDLTIVESLEATDHDQNIQKTPIPMIEASDSGESGTAKGVDEKALTRNMTRSLFPKPRRASPRINSKQVQQVNVSRARRGIEQTSSKKTTPGGSTQQKGVVDAKYPPHRHQ